MNKKTLLIIDLEQNHELKEKEKYYIYLNCGSIKLENCEKIELRKFRNLNKNIYKKFLQKLNIFFNSIKEKNFFLSEMEIFNLRNDRYAFPDRVINFFIIKEIILQKKIQSLKIISDNKSTLEIFDNLDINVIKEDLSKFKFKFKFRIPYIKILKFYFKTLFLIFFLKFQKKKIIINEKKPFYLSIFPNNFFYRQKKFFNTGKNICNFLLTDETHLNLSIKDLMHFVKRTNDMNIINIENYIKIKDILILILKHFFKFIYKPFLYRNIEYNFNQLNLKKELINIYIGSYINRSKLDIYKNAIPDFLKKNNVSSFNMYMFEYSFGFYLIRKIKNFSKKIKINGYQHGIFSNNLMWFDFINLLDYSKLYTPHQIFCMNKFSCEDYKSKYKNTKISFLSDSNFKKKMMIVKKIKINKNSDKILVIPGLHDLKHIYLYIKKSLLQNANKTFYFKLHPKNKFYFNEEKNLKKIVNFHSIKFSKVIISQTSSLHHIFLELKKNFSVIDFDFKQNIISSKIKKKTKLKIDFLNA